MKELSVESTYLELASALMALKTDIGAKEKVIRELKDGLEQLQDYLLPKKMNAEDLQTISVKGVGRLSVRGEVRISAKAANKFELQDWLKKNGFAELIGETINSSTLKAFVVECIMEGREYPEDMINMHSFDRVTLTKK